MASTTALFTGLSGLNANARNIDVIGNNISNSNTYGFKSNRLMFSSMFSRTFSIGTPPGDTTGGTNPGQIGLGVGIGGTQRNFSGGALSTTGDSRDLAIEGNGFFIVERGGTPYYTRVGAFRQNALGDLTTITGERLMGYNVDEQFNIRTGQLEALNIPVGTLTIAEATRNVRFSGNLDADGPLPTRGAIINLMATTTAGFAARTSASPAPTAPNVLENTTRLVDIDNAALAGADDVLFTAGQFIEIKGAQKGTKTIPDARLEITATTTVADLMTFLSQAMGINTTVGANPDANTPGLTLNPLTGIIQVVGNTGASNDLTIDAADIRLLNASGNPVGTPFTPAKTASADGESVRTTFIAYDSLGAPIEVDLTMVLDSTTSTGTQWRYYVESGDDTDLQLQVATGLLNFDTSGRLIDPLPVPVNIDRANTGAVTPLSFSIAFEGTQDRVTALASSKSQIAATFNDGSPIGTLQSYAVANDGTITGSFSNGLTRTVGQVAIGTFSNPEGLVDIGNNLFTVGPNSGIAVSTTPTVLGAGRIVGGALELSNVDLGSEFISLILASTGYSASTRVIQTTDQLMQQLLALGR
ncbi:MAG: flagellar hook-basal body complex protein [Planctomycetota bacterium]|nr:flagellar hook-basal body complex protein [Planctomycetota bacterium]